MPIYDIPIYDIEAVRHVARKHNIEYRGRKVGRDIANLGYTLNDVADCLIQLSPKNFRKTHYYQNQPPDDEYICLYRKDIEAAHVDELYIKFCLVEDAIIIDLASFHLA